MKRQLGHETTDDLAGKMSLFEKLPNMCSACQKGFDKQSREMVQSWSVMVKQEVVRLFCPECIEKTREVLNEYR